MNDFELDDIYAEMVLVDENNVTIKKIKIMDMDSLVYAMSLPKLEVIDDDFFIFPKLAAIFSSKIKKIRVPHNKIYWCNEKNMFDFVEITKKCIEHDYDVVIFCNINNVNMD
jgi:hypothetical protein